MHSKDDLIAEPSNKIDPDVDENVKLFRNNRSKTMPPSNRKAKDYAKGLNINPDRLKMAKEDAERAIKVIILLKYSFRFAKISFCLSKKKFSQLSVLIQHCEKHYEVAAGLRNFII